MMDTVTGGSVSSVTTFISGYVNRKIFGYLGVLVFGASRHLRKFVHGK